MKGAAQYREVQRTAANEVIAQHSDLVRRIAHHLAARLPASVEVDDLIQAGMMGLIEASRSEVRADATRNNMPALLHETGELLFPGLFPKSALLTARKKLGSAGYSGQHQQTPVPAEGNIFKPWWWRYWIPKDRLDLLQQPIRVKRDEELLTLPIRVLPYTLDELRTLPPGEFFSELAQSWDMAFKDTGASSFVVGQVWASAGADSFLLDQVRDKWDLPATITQLLNLTARWPHVTGKLIEDKANGPATMQMLRGRVGGMLPVLPYASKEARATGITPLIEGGNVYLPHPALFGWVDALQTNLTAFPNGLKDEIDVMTQYLQRADAAANAGEYESSRVRGTRGGR